MIDLLFVFLTGAILRSPASLASSPVGKEPDDEFLTRTRHLTCVMLRTFGPSYIDVHELRLGDVAMEHVSALGSPARKGGHSCLMADP